MLQPGDIVVVKSNTFIGRTIRKITNSWASHVAVYIGEGFVFEARPGGARTVSLLNYSGPGYAYRSFRLNVTPQQREKFICALIQRTGEGYDYGQIISLAAKRLFNVDLKADNKRLAICSELVYKAAQEAGISVPPIAGGYITPGDFLTWDIATEIK